MSAERLETGALIEFTDLYIQKFTNSKQELMMILPDGIEWDTDGEWYRVFSFETFEEYILHYTEMQKYG